jgi:uncharacterized protein (DUF983 family)
MLKAEFKKKVLLLDRNSDKSAEWEHCPRCVKGNMYPEYEDEHVCLQCGYRYARTVEDSVSSVEIF